MLRLIMSAVLVNVLALTAALADDYPSRPIRFLQGFAPGGNADVIARVLGDELSKSLGQPVITEARPGAGGNLASDQTAKASADGYTIVLLTTAHVISPALYKSQNFDPVGDFKFISTVSDFPFFFVVGANSRFKTIKDLVEAARSKPGAVTFGSAGVGTGQHMCGELFASSIGAKFVHVPFRGDSAAVTGLLTGDIDFIIAPATAVRGNIDGGTFRALAVSGAERWAQLPDVPTVAETVAPGFDMMAWMGVATARGVPGPVVERLNKELRRVIALPGVEKRWANLEASPGRARRRQ